MTMSVYTPVYGPLYGGFSYVTDSLIIGESIELIGQPGGTPSTNPLCAGAFFRLMPGFDFSAPQPTTDIVGSLLLDGERPFGYRASNRTMKLDIQIKAPTFQQLIAAREVLLQEVDQQTWTLRWTRDTTGPYAGNATALPLLFDCFRAQPSIYNWGGYDQQDRQPIGQLSLTFQALPYARNDIPVVVDFPSPLAGRSAPPAAINVDTFSSVSGTQWSASTQTPVAGAQSAYWDPGTSPAFNPQGTGLAATYTKSSLSLNLAAGWAPVCNATGTTTTFIISQASAVTAAIDIGDQFQLWNSTPALIQTQIFTVTKISEPSGGNVTVTYTPASLAAPVSTNSAIQTGPPSLNAITFWAGFGSSLFYNSWARLGGRVLFAITLTDTYSTTLGFSKTFKMTGSNNSLSPRWAKVRIPVPYQAGFDYANVASYSITVTNRGTTDLRYTQLYLSNMLAVPPPTVSSPSPQRGAIYELTGLPGSARAPMGLQFQQTGTKTYTQTFSVAGSWMWTAPPGVTTVSVFAIGGGGSCPFGANGGGGGGGGGSAANAAVAVTPGVVYSGFTGFGGIGGNSNTAASNSTFTGDTVTVTANHGANGTVSTGGAGGAAGTGGFAGGTGGAGVASGTGGGGAGGGSGGTAAAGNNGGAASGSTGGLPGAAVTGGGKGGNGGTHNIGNGNTPLPPGGGGGGSPGGAFGVNTRGASGVVTLTYTASLPGFQTLIAHRPPVTAPDNLIPFVSPNTTDTPNGTIQYPVASLVPGTNARFGGTYTVVLVAWSWDTPANSRTLTVTVTQNEQTGGAQYTSSVSTSVVPNTLPAVSGVNAAFGPWVILGELTLPVQDMPQDNINGYFTVSVTSTDTSDSFMDVLFLDTMGSTVFIQSPTVYANMYLDAPNSDRDIGLVLGSLFDRGDAVSVLDRAIVTGGPMSVDPNGNPMMLAYCAEGAPNLQMTYFPCWWMDRLV